MKISFWSPYHRTGSTAGMIAVAAAFEWKMNKSCLMLRSHPGENSLESCVLQRKDIDADSIGRDVGCDELVRRFKSGRLTSTDIYSCSVGISNNSAILTGPSTASLETDINGLFKDMLNRIINTAVDRYDAVFIDAEPGYSELSTSILKNSDIAVIVLNQGRKMAQSFDRERLKNQVGEEKLFYVFGMYDRGSRYTLKNLRRIIPWIDRTNSGVIPFNTGFFDSLEEGNSYKYLRNFLDEPGTSIDPDFSKNITDCAKKMIRFAEQRQD